MFYNPSENLNPHQDLVRLCRGEELNNNPDPGVLYCSGLWRQPAFTVPCIAIPVPRVLRPQVLRYEKMLILIQ